MSKGNFYLIATLCFMAYIEWIPSRPEQKKNLYIDQLFSDSPAILGYYNGGYFEKIESFETYEEARVAEKKLERSIDKGVWYDIFGFGRFPEYILLLIGFVLPIIFLLIVRYVFKIKLLT